MSGGLRLLATALIPGAEPGIRPFTLLRLPQLLAFPLLGCPMDWRFPAYLNLICHPDLTLCPHGPQHPCLNLLDVKHEPQSYNAMFFVGLSMRN